MFLLREYDTGPRMFAPSTSPHYAATPIVRQTLGEQNAQTGAIRLRQACTKQQSK
jgi:hypothetical protein